MKIKICSDSTCDLSPELVARYDIALMPLYVIMDGKTYRDGVDIHPEDIFRHVENGGKLCSTSAVNVEDYRQFFAQHSQENDAVIHINIGSKFSTCYQNATIAASNFSNVYVVDSMNLSTGQGLLVVEAARMSQQNMTAVEICSGLQEIRGRVETSFVMDQLAYMQKGGRCSSVTAFGANLLKIKPCIEVKDGAMGVVDKYRGHFERCIEKYIKERLKDRKDLRHEQVFITYTPTAPEVLTVAREAVAKYGSFAEVHETHAGCTVSCHCGPSTLGVLFIRK